VIDTSEEDAPSSAPTQASEGGEVVMAFAAAGTTTTPEEDLEDFEGRKAPLWYLAGWIGLTGTLGCYARLATDEIFERALGDFTEQGSPILRGSTLSNIMGCIVLGMVETVHLRHPMPPVLFASLTTGFCGAYTTFSGWEVQLSSGYPKQDFGSWFADFLAHVSGMGMFAIAHLLGLDYGDDWMRFAGLHRFREAKKSANVWAVFTPRQLQYLELSLAVFLIALPALLLALDSESLTRREWYMAGLFSPLGAILRFLLARFANERWLWGRFRFGTWIANISGTALLAALGGLNPTDYWGILVLSGFRTGFISSFTTMSTFTGEIVKLRHTFGPSPSWLYAIFTVVPAQLIASIIGPWT
jgi:CrcB protein